MPEVDPSTNGHRDRRPGASSPEQAAPARGSGVLLLTLVSAITGLNMLIGAGIGAVVGGIAGGQEGVLFLATIGVGLGGAVGVALGIRVAQRFGGVSGNTSRRLLTVCGLAGLVGSVAFAAASVAWPMAGPFSPLIVVVLPGLGALIGDRLVAPRLSGGSRRSQAADAGMSE